MALKLIGHCVTGQIRYCSGFTPYPELKAVKVPSRGLPPTQPKERKINCENKKHTTGASPLYQETGSLTRKHNQK